VKKLLLMLLLLPTLVFAGELKTIELNKDNTISFNDQFNAMSVAQKQAEILQLAEKTSEKDLYIIMYTPGGSISAGQLFINTVKALGKRVHTITIFSASMGYQTVQALGTRYILPSGILMSHRAFVSGLAGQFPGELNKRLDMLMKSTENMEKISSTRVGMSLEDYQKAIHDELWVIGQDAVDKGHADEVVLAKCDKSLSGTYIKTYQTFFGPVDVEFSNCPLISGPLRIVRGTGNRKAVNHILDYYNNIINKVEYTR
jgi:ATP-dependent protease ClpP protease subunit